MSVYVFRLVERHYLDGLALTTYQHSAVLLCSRAISDAQSDRGGGA